MENAEDILRDYVDRFPAKLSRLAPLPQSVVSARLSGDKPDRAAAPAPKAPEPSGRELVPKGQQKSRFTDDELAILAASAKAPVSADELVERTQIPDDCQSESHSHRSAQGMGAVGERSHRRGRPSCIYHI